MVGSFAHRPGVFGLSALAVAAGCGGTPEAGRTVELAIAPYSVPPGAEMLRCQEMALPSDSDIDVDRIQWAFSAGSHHVHVYASAGGEQDGVARTYDCPQAVDFDRWHLLVASENRGVDWTLPDGVAMHVEARQSLLIQSHYLNTTSDSDLVAQGSVIFRVAEPGTVQKRMAALFGQNRDIHVPPHESAHVEATCALSAAADIHVLMGHYHAHGRSFQAWVEPRGQARRTVYENGEADLHPRWTTYDDLHLGRHDHLGWSCDYDNPLEKALVFGAHEATEEHCNLFAFYTLDQGDAEFVPCVIPAKEEE